MSRLPSLRWTKYECAPYEARALNPHRKTPCAISFPDHSPIRRWFSLIVLVRWRKFTEFLAGVEGAELPLRTQALLTGNRLKANVPFHAWLVKPLLVGEKMKFGAFCGSGAARI